MKLQEYIDALLIVAKKYPDATLIYSKDDEGNAYQEVQFIPSAGKFDGWQFDNEVTGKKVNAICIN